MTIKTNNKVYHKYIVVDVAVCVIAIILLNC